MARERIVSGESQAEEPVRTTDAAVPTPVVRPRSIAEYVGQAALIERLTIAIEAVKVLDGVPGQDPWLRAAARMSLGRALTASKRFPEAEPVLQEAWGLLEPLGIDYPLADVDVLFMAVPSSSCREVARSPWWSG